MLSVLKKISFSLTVAFVSALGVAQAAETVKITEYIPHLDVEHAGETVRIERIQDPDHKLTNSFAKTSRPCPPFCVHPLDMGNGVKTVGEIELLDFLASKVKSEKGLLVDARMPEWHAKGTIPGAVNIPFTVLTQGVDNVHTQKILNLLGAKAGNSGWDFSEARDLMLFCNGLWCDQSSQAIKHLLAAGYPAEKLFWYRGGMQIWQLLGLTTVTP